MPILYQVCLPPTFTTFDYSLISRNSSTTERQWKRTKQKKKKILINEWKQMDVSIVLMRKNFAQKFHLMRMCGKRYQWEVEAMNGMERERESGRKAHRKLIHKNQITWTASRNIVVVIPTSTHTYRIQLNSG